MGLPQSAPYCLPRAAGTQNNNRASVGTGPILQGKVNRNMANSFPHSGIGARVARVGAVAMTVALGSAFLLDAGFPNPAAAQAKKAGLALDAEPHDTEWGSRAFEVTEPSGFRLTIASE